MNKVSSIAAWALLAASLPAQTPAKVTAKPAGLGKAEAVSNEDMNIRAYIELLRTDIKKSKAQIIGEVMQLDADQSARFWPLYKEFEAEYSALGDRIVASLRQYSDTYDRMTDEVADQLAQQVLQIEDQRNELKRKYYARFKSGLDSITAARFLQVENQLERITDLQMAAQLPVISKR